MHLCDSPFVSDLKLDFSRGLHLDRRFELPRDFLVGWPANENERKKNELAYSVRRPSVHFPSSTIAYFLQLIQRRFFILFALLGRSRERSGEKRQTT